MRDLECSGGGGGSGVVYRGCAGGTGEEALVHACWIHAGVGGGFVTSVELGPGGCTCQGRGCC